MGLMNLLFGGGGAGLAQAGRTVKDVAEIFVPNETRKMELSAEAYKAAQEAARAEFAQSQSGFFDRLMNGLNRLPRPFLAFGTIGLLIYAMVDPLSFARRMVGLSYVPEPLWWLMTAIVGFYFGAREAHYFRLRPPPGTAPDPEATGEVLADPAGGATATTPAQNANPARDALIRRGAARDAGGRPDGAGRSR